MHFIIITFILFAVMMNILSASSFLQINSNICPYDSFDSQYLISSSFSSTNCQKKIVNSIPIIRRILITPSNYTGNISDPCYSVFSAIYCSLGQGFANETYELAIYSNSNNRLTILLLEYDYELSEIPTEYFRRIRGNIEIQTLNCLDLDIVGCSNSGDFSGHIYVLRLDYVFFISDTFIIRNIIIDGSQMANGDNFLIQAGFFNIEPISDDPNYPIPNLIINNLKIENFVSLGQNNQNSPAYFVLNDQYFGNVFINNITLDGCFFPAGIIAFYETLGRTNWNNTQGSFLTIVNLIIQNYKINDSLNLDSELFSVSGNNMTLNLENVTIKNLTFSQNPYYIFIFFDINTQIVINSLTILQINGQNLFLLSSCALQITNFTIFDSSFSSSPIFISNEATNLTIISMNTLSSILIDPNSYFLINQGGFLYINNYLFDNITNFQFKVVGSNSSIVNGTFSSFVTNRLFIFDTSTFSLQNISFYSINVQTSFMLFNNINLASLNSLKFNGVVSLSSILEIENVNSLELDNLSTISTPQISYRYRHFLP